MPDYARRYPRGLPLRSEGKHYENTALSQLQHLNHARARLSSLPSSKYASKIPHITWDRTLAGRTL